MTADRPIRDAASIVMVRGQGAEARVLMGQRGAGAAFMPRKVVFPGGAVDAGDTLPAPLPDRMRELLARDPVTDPPPTPEAIAAAALRELTEETGLVLPDAAALSYLFRAVTPPGGSRRFDARFFLARAEDLACDPDDFSAACDELAQLQWLPLAQAWTHDLPFVTQIVLAEAEATLTRGPAATVPWFDNGAEGPVFRRIG